MTLIPHSPANLDALALRLLDVAALVRGMANNSRENQIEDLPLHSNKAQEWLGRLEEWAHDGAARLELQVMRERGARRSQRPIASAAKPAARRRVQRATKRP
ncbi:MAG TPA: hypothetical protein VHD36_19560 [Pirellulales bacterium]|nr:hypothetical protein [Pirellulales bacterium]